MNHSRRRTDRPTDQDERPPREEQRVQVLLIHADAARRDELQRLLSQRYAVTAVAEGEAALPAARAARPALVLVGLPIPEALRLAKALRTDAATAAARIVLLVAEADQAACVVAQEAGADECLPGEVGEQELLTRLEARVDLMQVRREATSRELALAEQALRQSEQQLQLALAAAGMVAWRWDLADDRVTVWRDGQPLQVPYAETAEGFMQVAHPDDHERLRQWRAQVRAGQPPDEIEFRMIEPDGRVRWFVARGRLELAPDGRPLHVIGVSTDITERRQAEQRLRDSEQQFRALYNSNVLPMTFWHIDGRVLEANDAYLRMMEASRDDLAAGRVYWTALTAPEYQDATSEAFQAVTGKSGGGAVYEKEYLLPSGRRLPVLVGAALLPGHHDRGVAFVLDQTPRKQAMQALREAQEQLQLALSGAKVAAWKWELDQDRIECMVGDKGLAGRRSGTFADLLHILHPDDVAQVRHARAQLEAGQAEIETELRCLADADVRWVAIWGRTQFDDAGRPLRVLGVLADITDRKRAEESLRANEARFSGIFNQAAVGISLYDASGRFILTNQKLCDMLGYTCEELLARSFHQITFPADVQTSDEQVKQLVAGEIDSFTIEKRYFRKDGSIMWGNLTSSAMRDASGAFEFGLGIVEDITQRKLTEQQLHALNETLEERVAERTAVAEQRAVQLRALAAELTQTEQRERRRLAQTLHDHLQQLLVAAKLRMGLTRSLAEDPEVHEAMRQVEDLIAQSIDASRSLTVELSPPILYEAGLTPALEWLARWMQEKHKLYVQVDHAQSEAEGPETIAEDVRVLLFESVRELLFNIVKHAQVDQARVSVNIEPRMVRIVVADEGAGFDPSTVNMADHASAGFGLFSIQQRLELLGGHLAIDSTPGQGSRITLIAPILMQVQASVGEPADSHRTTAAPRKKTAPTPGSAPENTPAPPHPAASPGGRERIRVLLADDHRILREGLAGLLRDQPDLEVVAEAADGEEAVALAHRTHPDVVVMDITMPRLSGVEATRRMTAELPGTRVIGLSIHEERDMAAAMREAGAAAYLTKGGPSEQLIACIRARSASEPDSSSAASP